MSPFTSVTDPEIIRLLQAGGIGVLRTDTLYGVVASARDSAAVARVYELKGRDDTKSPIVLISSVEQLFDEPDAQSLDVIRRYWPGVVSIILPSTDAPEWITRGNKSVAYRLPDSPELRRLLDVTGPLIAPSANPQGQAPAMNVDEAFGYFGKDVDFYVDASTVPIDTPPSRLLRLDANGVETWLR